MMPSFPGYLLALLHTLLLVAQGDDVLVPGDITVDFYPDGTSGESARPDYRQGNATNAHPSTGTPLQLPCPCTLYSLMLTITNRMNVYPLHFGVNFWSSILF